MNTLRAGAVFLSLLLLVNLGHAKEPSPVNQNGAVIKTVKVKDEKGKRFRLKKGQNLTVIYERGKWYWVKTKKGRQGWVKKKYVRIKSATAVAKEAKAKKTKAATPDNTEVKPALAAVPVAAGTKMKLAVLDLRGTENLSERLVGFLTNVVTETLDGLGPFKSISSQDIAQMLAYESNKQMLGCDDVSCLAEIGGALGADYMVSGSISQIDQLYVVQLQLTNIKEARVEARASREHKGEPEELFNEVRAATKLLVRDILGRKSGTMTLAVNEEGASVKIDGTILGSSPLETVEVSGGMHSLAVEKEGFVIYQQDIEIREKQDLALEVKLIPSQEFRSAYKRQASTFRTISLATAGLGLVALAGGGFFVYDSFDRASSLNNNIREYELKEVRYSSEYEDLQRQRSELATVNFAALALGGVGTAALVAGTALFFIGDDPDKYE